MKHVLIALTATSLLLAGCASTKSDTTQPTNSAATANMAEPEIQIDQLSVVPYAATQISGGLPIQYRIKIANHAGQPITLQRVDVQSIGAGAYTLPPSSRSVKLVVQPDTVSSADFWVSAHISDPTVYGANGPVTLRAVVQFDSPGGKFQKVFVQQVHEFPGAENLPD